MGAEVLGRRLLGEVEQAGLDEVLRSVRLSAHPELSEARFGIPPLDRLLHLFEQPLARHQEPGSPTLGQADQRHRPATTKPPLIELTSASPGAGKTQLLYLITTLAILPRTYDGIDLHGKDSCVVILDTDGRFSVARLASVAKNHIARCCCRAQQRHGNDENADPTHHRPSSIDPAAIDALVTTSLAHVHILQPQSHAALLSTLHALPAYLVSSRQHRSSHRPLHSILVDSASAFFWPLRAAEDNARLVGNTTTTATVSESYATLARTLRALSQRLSCAIVATTTTTSSPSHQHVPPSFLSSSFSATYSILRRPLLPSSWTAHFATLRLAVSRAPVPPFAPALSVAEAGRERAQRQRVVEGGRRGVRVDGWGAEAWGRRVWEGLGAMEAGGAWGFAVAGEGVVVEGEGEGDGDGGGDGEKGEEV